MSFCYRRGHPSISWSCSIRWHAQLCCHAVMSCRLPCCTLATALHFAAAIATGLRRGLNQTISALIAACCAGYIAPEVIRGIMQPSGDPVKEGCEDPNHHYGPPCDLWSAGIVLYMLLSGERPDGSVKRWDMSDRTVPLQAGMYVLLCFSALHCGWPPPSAFAPLPLAGMPPFYDKSEPRLLRSIMSGKFSFKDPVWEPVRSSACLRAASHAPLFRQGCPLWRLLVRSPPLWACTSGRLSGASRT